LVVGGLGGPLAGRTDPQRPLHHHRHQAEVTNNQGL
jgi:hypothetical protein